jgi:RecG-like helicase
MADIRQRATAIKLRIGDLLRGKPILENERLSFLELGNKQILRINIVANVVDRFETPASTNEQGESKKAYLSLTIDDASGQIRLKSFGEDVDSFKEIAQGSTVMVIGVLRFYNNEIYIQPEIIKIQDPRYLLVRKLELEKEMPKEVKREEVRAIKDQLIEMIKKAEDFGGLEIDKIIMELKSNPEIINQEIKKLLEEGLAYEPRPGKIRYLG